MGGQERDIKGETCLEREGGDLAAHVRRHFPDFYTRYIRTWSADAAAPVGAASSSYRNVDMGFSSM